MSLYERSARFRGTLFRDDEAPATEPLPRVLRGVAAAQARPVEDGPVLMPKVLRGDLALHTVRPFEVETMVPTVGYEPDGLDAAPDAAEGFVPAELPPQVEPARATVDEQAIRADEAAQWQARLEDAAARARENGYRDGYADAEKAAENLRHELRAAVEREMKTLHDAWRAHFTRVEADVAALAFEVAEAILSAPLPDNVRLVSTRALQEAVESIGKEPMTVTLHPVDMLRVQEMGLEDELRRTAPELRLHPDPFLNEGDWHIETDTASVRRIRTELLDTLRRRLGLLGLRK